MDKLEHPAHSHEESDVSTGGIVQFGVLLATAIGVVCLLVWGLFSVFNADATRTEKPAPPLYRREILPPEPRLQGAPGHQNSPAEDIKEFRAKENAELNSYGWVIQPAGQPSRQEAGVVRIPIERAKRLIVERGLPATPATATQGKNPGKKQ